MRVVAKLSAEPTFWVENVHDVNEVRAGVQIAKNDFVFLMEQSEVNDVKLNLQKVAVEQSKMLLIELFSKFSISKSNNVSKLDLVIGSDLDGGLSFAAFAADRRWQSLLTDRRRAVAPNERREVAFERLFRGLVSTSRHIQIVDPYAATDIVRQQGKVWLLDKMLSAPGIKIEIISRPPMQTDRTDSRTQSQLDAELSNAIAALRKGHKLSQQNFELYRIDPPRAQFHNRRLRIHNDTCSVSIVLERGIDVFDESRALEQQTFSEMSSGDFQVHWDRLRKLSPA